MTTYYIYEGEDFVEPVDAETEAEFVQFFNEEYGDGYRWVSADDDE